MIFFFDFKSAAFCIDQQKLLHTCLQHFDDDEKDDEDEDCDEDDEGNGDDAVCDSDDHLRCSTK